MARRIGETYIKCRCVGATYSNLDSFSTYTYEPVCGTGTIVLNVLDELSDDVVPMEHLRMKTQVDILTKLNYPVEDICRILDAPDYLINFYLPDGYVGLDHANVHNELHRLHARCVELLKERRKLTEALDSEKADNLLFEHKGKELTEENYRLTKELAGMLHVYHHQINALEQKVDELTKENGKLHETLEDQVAAHLQLEEKADTLSGEYIRVCKARDEHIKHINSLEHQIEDLEHEKQVTVDMYNLANKTLCEVRAENAKLMERIDAYAIITRSHIDNSSMRHEAYELGKWICTSVAALHQDGKTVSEIAKVLDIPESFVERVLKDF